MEYTIEAIARDVIKITLGQYDLDMTPVIIEAYTYSEEDADITISPGTVPTVNTYGLDGDEGDEFEITFNADGVYKLYITENGIDYIHIVYITNEIDDYFLDRIPQLICSNPLRECTNGINCKHHYDFNVLSLLTLSLFGETNENLFLDYEDLKSGILYKDQIYQCTGIGSGTYNWRDSGGNDLLADMSGNIITNTSTLELNAYYKCIKTGTPVEWGSSTNTVLTLSSPAFLSILHNKVDSIYKFYKYSQDCLDSNSIESC